MAKRDYEGFESYDSALIYEIASMGESMGLEEESEDIHKLLKSHKVDINAEELLHLQNEQQKLWLIICRLTEMR